MTEFFSDFRLYHSNALSVLAALLANTLREASSQEALLSPETILIPQPSMKRWLQIYLAESFGIAANLRCITPGEFVSECLQANLPDHLRPVLNTEWLRWRLFSILNDPLQQKHRALKPIAAYLQSTRSDLKAWSLAGECAAAFEKYQAWRRDWCLAWDRGKDPDDWQAHLWRTALHNYPHRAQAIDHYLQTFESGDAIPQGLPKRVFAFACSNVSPDVLRVIACSAKAGPLHFFFASPCKKYWGDLQSTHSKPQTYQEPLFAEEENPLLQQWGYAGRDFVASLFSNQSIAFRADIEAYAEAPGDTLLASLKNDVLNRRAPEKQNKPLNFSDNSVQIHSCHTRLREVQVLHDQLHRLFLEHPGIQPRDIAVMAPDIQAYAPFIEAVFGTARQSNRYIPYTVSDQVSAASQHVSALFLSFFELPQLGFTSNEVLAILSHPVMMQALRAEQECLQWWPSWIEQSGARWGLNAQHRQQFGAPSDHLSTWAFALDRLLLGYASGSAEPLANIEPVIHVEGQQALAALDALIRGLRMLAFYQAQFQRTQTVEEWAALCTRLLNTLYGNSEDNATEHALKTLHLWISEFQQYTHKASFDDSMAPEIVHAYFKEKIATHDGPTRILSGGVSFCRMVPMRQIPFQVICLLGLNEGEMPRQEPAGMIQRLHQEIKSGKTRRYGDRSLREEDRFLFLQLMMAAEQVFYLSYLGRDASNNTSLPASPLISELLDTIRRMYPQERMYPDEPMLDELSSKTSFILQHPLQVFSSPEDQDPRHVTFDPAWRSVNNGSRAMHSENVSAKDASSCPSVIDVQDFLQFFQHPAQYFLRQCCDVQLRSRFDLLPEEESFEADRGLEGYQLKHAVFHACLQDTRFDKAHWLQRFQQQALLPAGLSAEYSLGKILRQVHPVAQRIREWRKNSSPFNLDIDLSFDQIQLQGRMDACYPQGFERVVLGEIKGKHFCRQGIEALLLSAVESDLPIHGFYIHSKKTVRQHVYPLIEKSIAVSRLQSLLAIYRAGLTAPLAFLPDAAYVYWQACSKNEILPNAISETAWPKAYDAWPNTPGFNKRFDPWIATALRGQDPFLDAGDAVNMFPNAMAFHRLSIEIFSAIAMPATGDQT
jgi:exodeoxyribonuclease V gamma subunit